MPQDQARLFKERDAVVAPIENAQFPSRCVKTNAPVDSADYKIVIDLSPSQIRDGTSRGKIDEVIAGAIGGKTGRANGLLAGRSPRIKESIFTWG